VWVEVAGDSRTGDPRRAGGQVPFAAVRALAQDGNLRPLVDNGVLLEADRLDTWQG
jgi:hypothetical protein